MSQHPHPVGPTNNIAANFSPEMVIGSTPQRSRYAQQPGPAPDRDIQVAPPDVNPFSVEMAVGYHPDRPNLFKPFGIGQQVDTAEQVAAPFQNSMIEASRPVKSGVMRPLLFSAEKDWQVQPPEVPVFSIEMVKGWRPDRPVLFLPLRTGQQIPQSQHLAAPFSVEMTVADRPTRSGVMRPLLSAAE